MSPRAYKADARRAASAETRAQILEAARSLLGMDGAITFSVDAIAASADVARMTVYNQFGSKRGLVEALSDHLADRGGIGRLPEAFRAPTALAGLEMLVRIFVGFWDSEQLVIRRLRALSAIDPELSRSNRDERRRQAISSMVRRLAAELGESRPRDLEQAIDSIWVLSSFDTYEHLASTGKSADQIADLVWSIVTHLLELPETL